IFISPQTTYDPSRIGWDDPALIDGMLRTEGLPYEKAPRFYADCAITTQTAEFLSEYRCRQGRMMYGVGLIPPTEQVVSEIPLDFHLVHGPLTERIQSSAHANASPNLPPEKVRAIGYPKLDAYFNTKVKEPPKATLWLPTWGDRSSIDTHLGLVAAQSG